MSGELAYNFFVEILNNRLQGNELYIQIFYFCSKCFTNAVFKMIIIIIRHYLIYLI